MKIAHLTVLTLAIILTVYIYSNSNQVKADSTMRLAIPAIGLDSEVIPVDYTTVTASNAKQYLEWHVDDNLIGWHKVTAPMGEVGNTALSGHSDIKGMVFRRLNEVKLGDTMLLNQSYLYTVTDRVVVTEAGATIEQRVENAKWLLPTDDHRLTLITCISGTNRLIVVAKR